MKTEDLCVAVEELLKMKKIDNILPGCFTRRNMEGFKKTLNQKKGQTFSKEWKQTFLLSIRFFLIYILGRGSQNSIGVHQTKL